MKKEYYDEVSEIQCPYCGEQQYIEVAEGGAVLVTYHGEEAVEWECQDCKKDFWIEENVSRFWTSSKEL